MDEPNTSAKNKPTAVDTFTKYFKFSVMVGAVLVPIILNYNQVKVNTINLEEDNAHHEEQRLILQERADKRYKRISGTLDKMEKEINSLEKELEDTRLELERHIGNSEAKFDAIKTNQRGL